MSLLIILAIGGGVVTMGIVARTHAQHADEANRNPELNQQRPGVEPLKVEWMPLQLETGYDVTRWFIGRVEAKQESDLGFEVAGAIQSVVVDEGDLIEAGEVVATLDTQRLEARRQELQAALQQAQARFDLAEIRMRRISKVRERNAASADEYDEAESNQQAARADMQRARAAVDALSVDIEKSQLLSPFDAVVARRYVDAGRVVNPGETIVRLLERDHPEVRLGVGGAMVDRVEIGQVYNVQLRDRMVQGEVLAVLPTRDRAGRSVDVLLSLDASINGIRSGDLARVPMQREVDAPGYWLPTQALTESVRGLWAVYLLVESTDGLATLQRADVELLYQSEDQVFVRGSFKPNAKVVVGGLHRIAPGMTVRLNEMPSLVERVSLVEKVNVTEQDSVGEVQP